MSPPLPIDLTRRASPEVTLLLVAVLAGALLLAGPLFVAGAAWCFHRLRLDPSARALVLATALALCGVLLWAAFWPALRAAYGALFGGRPARFADMVTIWGLAALLIPIGGLTMAGSSGLGRWLRPPTLDEQLQARAAYEQALLAKQAVRGPGEVDAARSGGPLTLGRVRKTDSFPAWAGVRQIGGRLGLDDRALSEHVLLIGATGAGKTETLKRLIAEVLATGDRDLYLVDGKGDAEFARDVRGLAHRYGRGPTPVVRLGLDESGAAYDGFRGNREDIYNRFAAMIGVKEAEGRADDYYASINRTLLGYVCDAPGGPPRSFAALEERLDLDWLRRAWQHDASATRRLQRIKPASLEGLDFRLAPLIQRFGSWVGQGGAALEDHRALVFSLRTLSAGDTASAFLKFLLEDLSDFVGKRQTRPALLVIDEFGAFGAKNANRLLAQARGAGLGIVLATQSLAQLGDAETRQELLENTRTKLLMSTEQPDEMAALAGTVFQLESSFQHEDGLATGLGTTRPQHTYRVPPNEARGLAPGEIFLIRRGRAAKLQIDPVGEIAAPPAEPVIRLLPASVPPVVGVPVVDVPPVRRSRAPAARSVGRAPLPRKDAPLSPVPPAAEPPDDDFVEPDLR